MITAEMVKELRALTGVGMMDCKKALIEAGGDKEKAKELLREKGLSMAAKRAGRIAAQGIVDSYIHLGGKVGVLVEVNCETDFVARNEDFRAFVRDICLQVAATNPTYLKREDVPAEVIEKEKEILTKQALAEGKPEKIVEKIVTGRLEKFYGEKCLLEQEFIKDQDKTVNDLLTELIGKIGENIVIRRFVRFEMGEGLDSSEPS
ncbi:MAG TPA: translation elongation factor Ts [Firmicutes bacterium]|jgi:elongation factor Ts|nr:translation elongation factor Ts [Bacillota bacterium]